MGVQSVRRVQSGGGGDLGGIERTQREVVGAPEKRPVIGGEAFHRVQVAAQEQQEHRAPGQ
ncbi:hypothetical protein ACIG56_24610 [Nocardia fusca]|uniref:hypothetical protein n=1 Tax=Nocardia fusca TaxID=941183 RepID=UPI0037C60544